MPIGIPGCPEFARCTASIASARIALASSTRASIQVFLARGGRKSANYIWRGPAPNGDLGLAVAVPAGETDAELLELPIEVRALEPDGLRHARDRESTR